MLATNSGQVSGIVLFVLHRTHSTVEQTTITPCMLTTAQEVHSTFMIRQYNANR